MILIFHILIATLSLLYSIFISFNPTTQKIKNIYILTSGTILSGIVLVVTTSADFGKFCLSGLVYTGITVILAKIAKLKLANIKMSTSSF